MGGRSREVLVRRYVYCSVWGARSKPEATTDFDTVYAADYGIPRMPEHQSQRCHS